MKQKKEVLSKLLKPLKTEKKLGYNNSSVFGGFDAYILKWLNELANMTDKKESLEAIDELRTIFTDYAEVRPQIREKKLLNSKQLFNQLVNLIKEGDAKKKRVPKKELKNEREKKQKIEGKVNKDKRGSKRTKETIIDTDDAKTTDTSLPEIWQKSVRYVKGVGKKRAKQLARLGIHTIYDMLFYFPRDYRDWSTNSKIRELNSGSQVTVQGQVINIEEIRPRKGLVITKIVINDGTGSLAGVWFNQPYIKQKFSRGIPVAFSGKVKREYGQLQMSNPNYELINKSNNLYVGRVLPIYPTTEGLSQNFLRKIVKRILDKYLSEFPEFISKKLREQHNFLEIKQALKKIHFPDKIEEAKMARKRLAFDELFILQLGIVLRKVDSLTEEEGVVHNGDESLIDDYLVDLPFELTSAQAKVWDEIKEDMKEPIPMNRLIQGDVGSGKTVVATLALLKAVRSGYQGAMMAPTEILAEQHYLSLKESLSCYGIEVALLVGSLTKQERETVLEKLVEGDIDIVIGTHALIQEGINFANLGLVITDEQHRFGVRQRATFKEKGENPDVLVMTATPIPRTLALTLYGDLDLSVIDELPPGRKPVVTEWRSEKAYPKIYSFIRQELSAGRQAYFVCPLVEESEKIDVSSAVEMAAELQNDIFTDFSIGLLHGQLKSDKKEAIMRDFREQKIDILVSTTVIEVGVNVPNATLMVIIDAQRFGLAQLHQLRGRVGRGKYQSYCILIANPKTETGRDRMKIMTQSTDGFVIAEEDLKLRGPGEFFGTRQHGLPDLKIANLLRDSELLEIAREQALGVVEKDPELNELRHRLLKAFIQLKFGADFELIDIS
ncbi:MULTISPECIES: ATP-dependent DNA helicase RecG [unclassified Candidatus Frackibacter]|uniref:ATP-dependent DNA helicase RecG n=1 Tax=unclassified Candidatus Frackibacter TaxID=2648818 RepID=UPI000892008A|nr:MULTISPECIES: ATP-dependent DNA helicase RecG [unclassified Candidatus Frackibacter]SDC56818.1 ATP-dependent DNA helicase RecG [Candidatus Frackibacter sp. WG11]SEM71050.1 ATP-dependent DNA helicase RecG [Candidatus Frackibacter sp. WG12]SFL83303.1 ATP-dependent DNA helicase RecG [Candidatus Frackibacter sp. WG13]